MWEGSGFEWAQSQAGVSGKVHKWERLENMAFVWRRARTLVEVAKNESRDQ